jgi:hypothetical protein
MVMQGGQDEVRPTYGGSIRQAQDKFTQRKVKRRAKACKKWAEVCKSEQKRGYLNQNGQEIWIFCLLTFRPLFVHSTNTTPRVAFDVK